MDGVVTQMLSRFSHVARLLIQRTAGALITTLLTAAASEAAEWRYCYAGDDEARTVHFSRPFQTKEDMLALERSFRSEVEQVTASSYLSVACPRGTDKDEVSALISWATTYTRARGYTVSLREWPPSSPFVAR